MRYLLTILLFLSLCAHSQTVIRAKNFSDMSGVVVAENPPNDSMATAYNNGQWSEYTLSIPSDAWYTFSFFTATIQTGGSFIVSVDGVDDTSLTVTNNGSYYTFVSEVTPLLLSAGSHTLRITASGSIYWNLDRIEYVTGTTIYANAGSDGTYTLGDPKLLLLAGTGADPDHGVASYGWSKISGPNTPTFLHPSSDTTSVTGLVTGTYVFRFTVTGNDASVATDDRTVVVRNCSDGHKIHLTPDGMGFRGVFGKPGFTGSMEVNPGDTLVFHSADVYSGGIFLGLIDGIPGCRVVVENADGQVQTAGIQVVACTNMNIRGDAVPGTEYGFKMTGTDGEAVHITNRSKNIDVHHYFSDNCTYVLKVKQNPDCDPQLNWPTWTMDSIRAWHIKGINTKQDAFYIGHTTPNGFGPITCGSVTEYKYPFNLDHFEVWDCIVDGAQRTGMQFSETRNLKCHDNIILNCGYEYNHDQGTGIFLGGRTKDAEVYNNTVKFTFLNGVTVGSKGQANIHGNIIDSIGWLYIEPHVDLDSLKTQLDIHIHNEISSAWNTGTKHLASVGRYLVNNFDQPKGIVIRTDRDVLQEDGVDSTEVTIRSNKIGEVVNVTSGTDWTIITGANTAKVTYEDVGNNPVGYENYICSNTLMDGTTPADLVMGAMHYFTDCSGLGLPTKYQFKIPIHSRIIFKHQ